MTDKFTAIPQGPIKKLRMFAGVIGDYTPEEAEVWMNIELDYLEALIAAKDQRIKELEQSCDCESSERFIGGQSEELIAKMAKYIEERDTKRKGGDECQTKKS